MPRSSFFYSVEHGYETTVLRLQHISAIGECTPLLENDDDNGRGLIGYEFHVVCGGQLLRFKNTFNECYKPGTPPNSKDWDVAKAKARLASCMEIRDSERKPAERKTSLTEHEMTKDIETNQASLDERVAMLNPVLEQYLNASMGQCTYVLLVIAPPNEQGKAESHIATNLPKEHAVAALAMAADKLGSSGFAEAMND